ncbi:chitobiase/beta-hexosaminidase C-terminal domain-containing protein [Portibacter lacus]|uniref:GH29D-like beta-sandwich domain-containing protein n=1 Tax=Portibacter lacus TaxID=1099794 RepID=A0AA37WBX3_9BACT|nr:chitobiase/beta-hexosaminidase C-terminal domain-containing protein [Portibacter lacus]GLR15851.1 hypothetical protein GCM10007940_04660 [Portibacter lacus]
MQVIFTILFCGFTIFQAFGQPFHLSSPKVTTGEIIFSSESFLKAEFAFEGAALKYTVDGSKPNMNSKNYSGKIKVNKDQTIKIAAFHKDFLPSTPIEVRFIKIDNEKKIKSLSIAGEISEQYKGDSEKTLYDLQKGSANFSDGKWLGFKGQDVGVAVELVKPTSKLSVMVSTMTNTGSWIMGPGKVELQIWDAHTEKYSIVDEVTLPNLTEDVTINTQFISLQAKSKRPISKFKIVVSQLAEIPKWHPGNHDSTWIFLDEIVVK